MKNRKCRFERVKRLAKINGRYFEKIGNTYMTADLNDGSDAFYSRSLKAVEEWEKGYLSPWKAK